MVDVPPEVQQEFDAELDAYIAAWTKDVESHFSAEKMVLGILTLNPTLEAVKDITVSSPVASGLVPYDLQGQKQRTPDDFHRDLKRDLGQLVECPLCDETGKVRDWYEEDDEVDCPACGGAGEVTPGPQLHEANRLFWERNGIGKSADTREVQVAGLAVHAIDTGRLLMLQRTLDESDPAGGYWEFPGGHLEEGEDAPDGAQREWMEETGLDLPKGEFVGAWSSGIYEGLVYQIPREEEIDLNERDSSLDPDGDYFEALAWWTPEQLRLNPALRPELRNSILDVLHAIPR